jgi:hypothetical protein
MRIGRKGVALSVDDQPPRIEIARPLEDIESFAMNPGHAHGIPTGARIGARRVIPTLPSSPTGRYSRTD